MHMNVYMCICHVHTGTFTCVPNQFHLTSCKYEYSLALPHLIIKLTLVLARANILPDLCITASSSLVNPKEIGFRFKRSKSKS